MDGWRDAVLQDEFESCSAILLFMYDRYTYFSFYYNNQNFLH